MTAWIPASGSESTHQSTTLNSNEMEEVSVHSHFCYLEFPILLALVELVALNLQIAVCLKSPQMMHFSHFDVAHCDPIHYCCSHSVVVVALDSRVLVLVVVVV